MTPNDEYTPIDTPIQRINEDMVSSVLGSLIMEVAAPLFDEVFKAREEELIEMVTEWLKTHGAER